MCLSVVKCLPVHCCFSEKEERLVDLESGFSEKEERLVDLESG